MSRIRNKLIRAVSQLLGIKKNMSFIAGSRHETEAIINEDLKAYVHVQIQRHLNAVDRRCRRTGDQFQLYFKDVLQGYSDLLLKDDKDVDAACQRVAEFAKLPQPIADQTLR